MKCTAVVRTRFCHGVSGGQDEARRQPSTLCGLPLAEAQDARGGVGGLGVGCGLAGRELELVQRGRMVRSQTEQPRDGLGAEARGRREARGLRALVKSWRRRR